MTAPAHPQLTAPYLTRHDASLQHWLLRAGIAGAAVYPIADILASTQYPGFSYRDQAVSELFAIGALTSGLVVPLFTLSSVLLLAFAFGIWMSANGRRIVHWIAVMMALNAIDALLLWNAFPMHMRGVEPTFTDVMHGLLAIDPFLLAATVLAAVAFPGRFRAYTIANILFTFLLAVISMQHITAVIENQPTPWMGATERAAQYATNLWYAVFAVMLLRTKTVAPSSTYASQVLVQQNVMRFALLCGVLSAIVYAGMLVVVPMYWTEYSSTSQTVSELSAIGAPTRSLWVTIGMLWTALYAVFGWAVWKNFGESRALRIAGGAILTAAIVGIFWPPMHLRGVLAAGGGSLTDTMHIGWTAMNGVLSLLAMSGAAAALGWRFRIYTIATMILVVAAGAITSADAANLQANLPTPLMGAWERVNIGAWLLWTAVLSMVLPRRAQGDEVLPIVDVHAAT